MDMKNTEATTVQALTISGSDEVRVDREQSGDYAVRLILDGQVKQTRWAWGSSEVGLRNATNAARSWASGIAYDRTR